MSRNRRVSVWLTRAVDIEVVVNLYEGTPPTWTDPGDQAEAWIIEAHDGDGAPIELDKSESDEAVQKAWRQAPDSEPEYEREEDEQHKPF